MKPVDLFIALFDGALKTLIPPENRPSQRQNPAQNLAETDLSLKEKQHIAGLMRVNHAGEVCAQALYQGQALTAKLPHVKNQMQQAAAEESDHLAWCESRLKALNSQPSRLNPIWYTGAFFIGAFAGWLGDKWSLGFVAETEHQVSEHLDKHLKRLPAHDLKTHAILSLMQEDELNHEKTANEAGAAPLPYFVKKSMKLISKIMTKSSYYL